MTAILQDTTLCSIVRDEMMNPAGGIRAFARSTLPFVEAGVIVDTGSVDGTREALQDLQREFPHLQVFDRPFDDYASSRNFSLCFVQTTYALVLDADEIIADEQHSIQGGYEQLARIMHGYPHPYYWFKFKDVQQERITFGLSGNPRLFRPSMTTYINYLGRHGEHLHHGNDKIRKDHCLDTGTNIFHFRSTPASHGQKWTDWYEALEKDPKLILSHIPTFQNWKEYNPKRELFF
jgi:glycosyltransferase involved in cell wall biosynthesis